VKDLRWIGKNVLQEEFQYNEQLHNKAVIALKNQFLVKITRKYTFIYFISTNF